MKRLILLFVFLLSTTSVSSQNESIENARWVNGLYTLEPMGNFFYGYVLASTTKYCTTAQDTILNNQNYLQLFDCTGAVSYRGAIRVVGPKWYFFAKDSASEMLLYDFGLVLGDTLKEPFFTETASYNSMGWPLVVGQVDTITFFGTDYKQIRFFPHGPTWVENVGSPGGLLWDDFPNLSSFKQSLECFSQGDSIQFSAASANYIPDSLNTACPLNLNLPAKVSSSQALQLYPNPAKDHIKIEWGSFKGSFTLEVLTLEGKLLLSETGVATKNELDFNLADGLYVLRLKSGQNVVSQIFSVRS